MSIVQETTTEILLEGDSVTIVEETVYVEAITLFTKEEDEEFTPMFAPLFAPDYEETKVIPAPVFEEYVAPIIRDMRGNQTWLC